MSMRDEGDRSWTSLCVCGLLVGVVGAAASEVTEDTAVDVAFLEFLGTWDTQDDQWLGAAITAVASDAPTEETSPETMETDDDEN